jgi:pyruvate dehydrogenase E1 component beta subunit
MLERVLKALADQDAEVIDLLTLTPFDAETVLASLRKTGRLVIVHEAARTGGFGAEIAATVAEEGMLYLRAPILRVAAPDVPVPLAKLMDYYLPSAEQIRAAVAEVLTY